MTRRSTALTDAQIAKAEKERESAPDEDVTRFEEDDDPTKFIGEVVADGPEEDD